MRNNVNVPTYLSFFYGIYNILMSFLKIQQLYLTIFNKDFNNFYFQLF